MTAATIPPSAHKLLPRIVDFRLQTEAVPARTWGEVDNSRTFLVWEVAQASTVQIDPTVGAVGQAGRREVPRGEYRVTATNAHGSATRSVKFGSTDTAVAKSGWRDIA